VTFATRAQVARGGVSGTHPAGRGAELENASARPSVALHKQAVDVSEVLS
jgi:hypothetical protein